MAINSLISKSKKFLLPLVFAVSFLAFSTTSVLAQTVTTNTYGANYVNQNVNLVSSSGDLVSTITRIINYFLGFLALIAVVVVLIAGFLWMASGGNEEKIAQAKSTLRNGLIGLMIILLAWVIVYFVMKAVLGDTGAGNSSFNNPQHGFNSSPFGALGNCSILSVYPEPGQTDVARNTSIIITFKEAAQLESLCKGDDGNACACTSTCNNLNISNVKIGATPATADAPVDYLNAKVAASSDHMTFVIKPITYFTANTNYTVTLTDGIKKAEVYDSGPNVGVNKSMFEACPGTGKSWDFAVGDRLDLTPPFVVENGVFPNSDNDRDSFSSSSARAASGSITLNGTLTPYSGPKLEDITSEVGGAFFVLGTSSVASDYKADQADGQAYYYRLTIVSSSTVQLLSCTGLNTGCSNSLGIAHVDENNFVNFNSIVKIKLESDGDVAGNECSITLRAPKTADTLTVGGDTYAFTSASSTGLNIQVSSDRDTQAANIVLSLSGRHDILAIQSVSTPSKINLNASAVGIAGNDIELKTNNASVISLSGSTLSGGQDAITTQVTIPGGVADKPMNSVIQINFSEALNPLRVAGTAQEVANTIRVVNADGGVGNNEGCKKDSECLSYSCKEGDDKIKRCAGDYVAGKFVLSSGYKVLEFTSDNECGINGCGGKIYCLPADGHVQVQIMAAKLGTCTDNSSCSSNDPYTDCLADVDNGGGKLSYLTCQNKAKIKYPAADFNTSAGIIDTAFNSFDGNRVSGAQGSRGEIYYDENSTASDKIKYGDNYRFSFYLTSQIIATAPTIVSVTPDLNQTTTALQDPELVKFNRLMLNSTLHSGTKTDVVGGTSLTHQLMNLSGSDGIGYWITGTNLSNIGGEPNYTLAKINHPLLSEALKYNGQIGSGVNDIYQNCFKPSEGVGCGTSALLPTCCNGIATSSPTCQ